MPFGPGELRQTIDHLNRPEGFVFTASIVEQPADSNWEIGIKLVEVKESERVSTVVSRGGDARQVMAQLEQSVADRTSTAAAQAFHRIRNLF